MSIFAGDYQAADQFDETFGSLSLPDLQAMALATNRAHHGSTVSFSKKVFIPLTQLCRDVCGYCTFAKSPKSLKSAYLPVPEVIEIARLGKELGCKEALFTLGDKPELRYKRARDTLATLGFKSTVDYLRFACSEVLRETGLLPHVNAGVMTKDEMESLRDVSVSQGIMLESVSQSLLQRGGAHFGSPDKEPEARFRMMEEAGELRIPFSTGILVGIGETKRDILASLFAIKRLHAAHGHIQEVIVQNFLSKPSTRMAGEVNASRALLHWSACVARIVLGPQMNIQVPPNLSFSDYPDLLECGINDWGGVSPVTPDHVNPEAPWPQIATLKRATNEKGCHLEERLAVYPAYVRAAPAWQSPKILKHLYKLSDTEGFARADTWHVGNVTPPPTGATDGGSKPFSRAFAASAAVEKTLSKIAGGHRLEENEVTGLFVARGKDVDAIVQAADELRVNVSGQIVRYVVNRNINYTNVCTYSCKFCAFSKGKTHEALRGVPYNISREEIKRRVAEAWERGATEVCMQGGIHPDYNGATYLDILRAAKEAAPRIHVHAFSPLEIQQGAESSGWTVDEFLRRLVDAGLGSLPGTAAEILDDEVRNVLCPDKLNTQEWLAVIETAHKVGLRTTATIMFGHVESSRSWSRHLLEIRDLQERTGGFTEFVPLPFVHMEAPIALRGQARSGPTWREVKLMHAVSRLVLHPLITNIQASWVKLGLDGVQQMLSAGVNDLGGTLMNESISRAAGTQHGQELPPEEMNVLIQRAGRIPMQRTTKYGHVDAVQEARSYSANELAPIILDPVSRQTKSRKQIQTA